MPKKADKAAKKAAKSAEKAQKAAKKTAKKTEKLAKKAEKAAKKAEATKEEGGKGKPVEVSRRSAKTLQCLKHPPEAQPSSRAPSPVRQTFRGKFGLINPQRRASQNKMPQCVRAPGHLFDSRREGPNK